uniref:Transport and Golgi organization protein 1 n=1 Tax=Bactrocera latifrons TaxID=174628 RepID=A0A0K8W8W0_BACLA
MFGRRKCSAMNSALIFLGVCSIFLPTNWVVEGLSDLRLCADPQCQSIISLGTGKISYRAGKEGMVSFKINSKIRIKSKSAGKDPTLWGIEVNGREGYAPKEYILEEKVLVKDKELLYTVPVTGSQTISSTATPIPVATLKPSESIPIKKEDVEITPTAPLSPQLETEKSIPLTSREREPTKEDISQATPVQSNIEIIDGTEILVLEKVEERQNNFLENSPDNTEIPEKQPFGNSIETSDVKKQVSKPEQIVNNADQQQNTSITEVSKEIGNELPKLGSADDDGNIEGDEDDYAKEEDYSGENEDKPITGENGEEITKKESNDSNSLTEQMDLLNTQSFNKTDEDKAEDSSETEKSNVNIIDGTESHTMEEKPPFVSLGDNITVINETIGTETTTEKSVTESVTLPQEQLSVPQEVASVEKSSASTLANETGKEVPSVISERLPVPNTLTDTTALEAELQSNVSIETTIQSTSATTSELKVDENDSSADHGVPILKMFETPNYRPQDKYKQEQQHTHLHTHSQEQQQIYQFHPQDQNQHLDPSTQQNNPQDQHQHLDPSTLQNNIPQVSEETTTKAADIAASQRSEHEELHTPYYPKAIDEQTLNQPPSHGVYSYEAVTESSTSKVKSEQLDTVSTVSSSDVQQSNEVKDASDKYVESMKTDEESRHKSHLYASSEEETIATPAEESNRSSVIDVVAVEENLTHTTPISPVVDEIEKPVLHSTPIPPIEEYETTTTAAAPSIEEYETTTPAPLPSIEEFETTTAVPSPSIEEYETTTKTSEPVEENERTRTNAVPNNKPEQETKEQEQGLFATILGTVNNFLSHGKKRRC